MNRFNLSGKTILVTGASSGIGRQCAISISEMGATLIICGRDETRLNETFSMLQGADHTAITADLLDEKERTQLTESLPGLDGIVHSAGILKTLPIKFIDQEKINETLNINYEIPVLLMSSIMRKKKLNPKASVVFISSISGQHPYKGGALYAGSKAALEAFSKTLALEVSLQESRSNCISPAMVKTPMFDLAEQGMSKEAMDEHIRQYPLGVGYPEDVANTVVFLLSEASRWITGINITLDGGFILQK
ncbi:MAG: SDR family oxidoreductase [Bacteroidota bacterium]|nr:SDR family oxidoreductase [Bacteroidota bacterium]